jgi:hypothetical protein
MDRVWYRRLSAAERTLLDARPAAKAALAASQSKARQPQGKPNG